MNKVARHRWASWLLLAALLFSAVPAAALTPAVAQAEGRLADSPDQTTANPNEEIVYLDNNGFVKVLDIEPTGTAKQIQFVSPQGGFRNLALGDFNNNGDLEIVAVKGTNASDSVAVIYDPLHLLRRDRARPGNQRRPLEGNPPASTRRAPKPWPPATLTRTSTATRS